LRSNTKEKFPVGRLTLNPLSASDVNSRIDGIVISDGEIAVNRKNH